uniref:Uncharacterized protein n=1 Tax=Tanacetum cinerariifolium TaxID=118510 RepID=A0A6L2NSS5_TANCI|nr:hypothetical protein [Tanacetum cinerariifolium]
MDVMEMITLTMDQDRQMLMVDDNVRNQFRQNTMQNVGHLVRENAVQKQGIQNVGNRNGLSVVSKIANQYGNGNVETTPAEGNGNGINGAYDEIEKVTTNCNLQDNLQQAATSGTQSDKDPVYDSYGSAKVQLGDQKGKIKDTPYVSNTLDPLSQKLENENVELEFQKLENENIELEFQVLNYAKENAHLKTTYKNLFNSISVTRTQTKTIIDSLKNKLHDTIYKNSKLRAQLFDKVSEQKDTTHGTSTNTKFAKQSILGKPSSSSRPKLYDVTPLPKSKAIP